jgi:hypothetical protein
VACVSPQVLHAGRRWSPGVVGGGDGPPRIVLCDRLPEPGGRTSCYILCVQLEGLIEVLA